MVPTDLITGMATIVFRPELCNPAKDKEVILSFADIVAKAHESNTIDIKAGINYKVNDEIWNKAKSTDAIKDLLSIGALREEEDVANPDGVIVSAASTEKSLEAVDLAKALDLIDNSFDVNQLSQWLAKENRIKVRNSVNKRLEAIRQGNA